ncbi:MAG TPA: tetratricopeptide repeat protein, partial [Anaerolineales bacterium]
MHRVVPELIVENYRAGRYSGEFPAVGMFLDLSGFSIMTDALMQHGQHGAEVLAGLMHGVFDPLVESIFHYGGKIIGFAGDGIMALYPIVEDAETTALRALSSAHVVQQRLTQYPTRETVYGTFPISARIGLTIGSVSWGILFSANREDATYYFRGTAVDDSANAEHYAAPGDVLLTAGMAKLLQGQIMTVPHASYQRLDGFRVDLPDPTPIHFPPVDLDISRHFMPEEVITHDVRGEFRQIVNLFMRFPDLSHEALQHLMAIVFKLRKKYGGLVSRLDFGDKGCNMLMLWGAPVAYENDIGRALNFMLALQSKVDFPITAGATYYISHAGYLGSALCEDYTCYGWGVNLASRFMMGADIGQIWVDDRIARRVSRRFEIEFIGSQRFKGFAERQKVHLLRGYKPAAEVVYQGELVGREDELAQLASFADPLWQKRFAGLLLVSGEAGIGKGRLVHEFRLSDLFERNQTLWAVCQSNQILRQSFNPLRGWLLRYFGISPDQSAEERKRSFDSKLDDLLASVSDPELASELDRMRSILAALVDIFWPESLYEQLDAEGRYNNTFLALIALLKAESLRQPVVFFLEDLQFTDSDTKDLLPRLKRAVSSAEGSYPIALIVTARPHDLSLADGLIDGRLHLRGLPQTALARLIETLLGGEVAPPLVTLVLDRSEGNPYFAEQIIRYLQDENRIEMSQAGWALGGGLRDALVPGDVQAVLVARLDQLAREVREIVQTASVLGREFEVIVLVQMLQEEENVHEYVSEAEKAAIWAPLNEMRYIFSHGLLRDAAYAMQMRARRRELHALAVEALERLYGDDLKQRYAELAYHAEHAQFRVKARQYYTLAGKAASDLYQNSQGIDYYTRALAHTLADDLQTQFNLLIERAGLFNRIGERTLQSQDLASSRDLARQLGKDELLAKAKVLHAQYCFTIGDYPTTIEISQHVLSISEELDQADLALGVYVVWAQALFRLGKLDEAKKRGLEGLQLARQTRNRLEEGRSLTSMGLIALETKEHELAEHYLEEAVAIARETNERALESRALANLANSAAYVQRDYATARAYYEQAYGLAVTQGDRYAQGLSLGNLGWISGMLGDFVAAQKYHEQALQISREVGNIYQETYTLMNLSGVSEARGEVQQAFKYATHAFALCKKAHDVTGEAWSYLYLGNAYTLIGQFEDA